jgi:hypothetical protein
VNETTGIASPSTFGSLTDSVHYQLTFKKMKWGRNTWIQHRFLSNVQDLPIENVKVCNMMLSVSPDEAKYEPEFEGRVKYAPRIKGSQPSFEINNNVSLPWTNATASGQGFKTVCVTVPYVKAKGIQKVYFLYSSDVCSTSIVWKGWVEFDNPFKTLYPGTAPDKCLADQTTTGPNKYNVVRTYGVRTSIPLSFPPSLPSSLLLLCPATAPDPCVTDQGTSGPTKHNSVLTPLWGTFAFRASPPLLPPLLPSLPPSLSPSVHPPVCQPCAFLPGPSTPSYPSSPLLF